MAVLIQIQAPDMTVLVREKTFLSADTAKGATALPVENEAGFVSSDSVIVGAAFTEGAELNTVASTPSAGSGSLSVAATAMGHKRNSPVYALNYNRFKVYRATTRTGTYADVTAGGVLLEPDQPEWYYRDTSGTVDSWYKITFAHSNGDETPVTDAIPFQVGHYYPFDPLVLRRDYMLGSRLVDFYGNPLRDETILRVMQRMVSRLETFLGINIFAKDIVDEKHDYHLTDYQNWCYLRLFQKPVISVASLKIRFPENSDLVIFPVEWIQLDADAGQINLVPATGSISSWMIGQAGFFPLMMGRVSKLPMVWRVNYRAGFEYDKVPEDIQDVVYKMSAIALLSVLGDSIYGPGVASRSISLDGMSQSIGTVANAAYGAFSARMTQFQKDIDDMRPRIKSRYTGIRMTVA